MQIMGISDYRPHVVPLYPESAIFTPVSATGVTTTLTIASALSIGSNLVAVGRGDITMPQALLNGVAKGAAATLVLSAFRRTTVMQVVMTVFVLGGAGYLIESAMREPAEADGMNVNLNKSGGRKGDAV